MSETNGKIEWYLARDGQQHGPLSDAELTKFRELGHLKPDDLVWRAGFPEWRTAGEVFPETQPELEPLTPVESDKPEDPEEKVPTETDHQDAEYKPQEDTAPASEVASDENLTSTSHQLGSSNDAAPEPHSIFGASEAEAEAEAEPHTNTNQHSASLETNQHPHNFASAEKSSNLQEQKPLSSTFTPHPQHQPSSAPHSQGKPGPDKNRQDFSPMQGSGMQGPGMQNPGMQSPRGGAFGQASYPFTAQPTAPASTGQKTTNTHASPASHQPGQGQGFNRRSFDGQQNINPSASFQGTPKGPSTSFHQPAQQQHTAAQPGPQHRQNNLEEDDDYYEDYDGEQGGRSYLAITASVVFIAFIGISGWFAYANQNLIGEIIADFTEESAQQAPATIAAPSSPASEKLSPAPGSPTVYTPQKLAMLSSTFWRDLRIQDTAWTRRQEDAIDKLRAEGKPDAERLAFAVSALVDWRRTNADKILTAAPDELRQLARSFVANLKYLVNQDVKACYGFISKGELSSDVLPFYSSPAHLDVLGSQTRAIIAAARRKDVESTQYLEPRTEDFNALAKMLLTRGWTEEDLKMFSDPASLSSAPESKVCKLCLLYTSPSPRDA